VHPLQLALDCLGNLRPLGLSGRVDQQRPVPFDGKPEVLSAAAAAHLEFQVADVEDLGHFVSTPCRLLAVLISA
jgi:hypothetical protein